ncbi:hypothetical protein BJF79_00200 [Actinomadura sp. CNU-125]|uniref:DUF397 domain-containing protein n=1 Tax=Actinomadura sp. CNU-125 TaxID=1904961 RepID=UPI00096098B4|nr:DUF397 domain-containing protein [Actinomadura sp. CNU-125]OLT31669.1 hypothetical protein BJF79_00200 [Actinomadura sp. CNU-125]
MNVDVIKWRKSKYSSAQGGDCVEVASLSGNIGVRDSKDPDGAKLLVRRDVFAALVADLKR